MKSRIFLAAGIAGLCILVWVFFGSLGATPQSEAGVETSEMRAPDAADLPKPGFVSDPLVSVPNQNLGGSKAAIESIGADSPTYAPMQKMANFPRGLASSVQEALSESRADSAMKLVGLIEECVTVDRDISAIQSQIPSVKDVRVQRGLAATARDMQSFSGQCQAIGGSISSTRTALLELARDGKVVGAADKLFSQGSRDKTTLLAIARDANEGDLGTLATLASSKTETSGIAGAEQNIYRLALLLASKDPELGRVGVDYLHLAERLYTAQSATSGGAKLAPHELDRLSISRMPMEGSVEARAAALRILERMRKKMQVGH